jgi:hypothetical protein
MEVERTTYRGHQCLCQLSDPDRPAGATDRCIGRIDNPDQPVCDECERSGHHLLPNQIGLSVRPG